MYNEVQLSALKAQLNPHFLFNTFNTLYGISLKYPEQTSDMIMHVSQLMRYQVESSSKEFVSIDDEVSFISSYIQLEKERVGYRCKITYTANLDSERQYKIAPMLLISFVENAFKHGACTIEDCFVTIDIMIKDNKLLLNISNSIPAKKRDVVSTKIGLKNTQKRLEIIYPERHKLEIKPTKTVFNVNLEIDLN
ncbi:LytS/YehU family sensor histidine kinase [Chryseobacterium ginsenosidimutans]|uniref:sensor histidine kinase n=1 Tax=Chryseobacterium ginsenosidimutans TaxID=687846 RepID=UPI002169874F|nr:histidine kinase [Chryseobacterium ginsenosidimutans]MCS3870257.1 LytS/YehU family sensor histidine kinase [Chryseobacterium ginsenosidimutans]